MKGIMWPMLLDYSRDECKRMLRCLELEAYASVVSAFRAQGILTKEKKKLLQDLSSALCISLERHRAEVRRAVNDERLNTIADRIAGPNTGTEWAIEGRRLIPLMPRLVPQTAFTDIANSAANIQAAKNAAMPPPSATGVKESPPSPQQQSVPSSIATTSSSDSIVPPASPDIITKPSAALASSPSTSIPASPPVLATPGVSVANNVSAGPKNVTSTSSSNSSVVVLPSGMSIHIKGGDGNTENESVTRKRKQSPSVESMTSPQKFVTASPSTVISTTVTLPTTTSVVTSTSCATSATSLPRPVVTTPINTVRITLAASSQRTTSTVVTSQGPKVILVSTSGGSISPSILQRSLNVPVVKTVSPNITTMSVNQSKLSMAAPPSSSTSSTSSASSQTAATCTTSSTLTTPIIVSTVSSSAVCSTGGGTVVSSTAVTSATQVGEGSSTISTSSVPSPFVASTVQTTGPQVMKARPKTPVTIRQHVRPRSSIVIPSGHMQVMVPSSSVSGSQAAPASSADSSPRPGVPVARATVQYRQEGGLKVITQGIPVQTNKLFPKTSSPGLSQLIVVSSANVTSSTSIKQSLISSGVVQSSGNTKVVSVIAGTQATGIRPITRQPISPSISPGCRSTIAATVKVPPAVLGQTTPIVVRAAPPGMKPNVIVVHKSQVLQHGSQGRTIVVSSGSPMAKLAGDASKLERFKPPASVSLARTVTLPQVGFPSSTASLTSTGVSFTTFTTTTTIPSTVAIKPLSKEAVEKITLCSNSAKPTPSKEPEKEEQKSNLLADLILATGILPEGGGSSSEDASSGIMSEPEAGSEEQRSTPVGQPVSLSFPEMHALKPVELITRTVTKPTDSVKDFKPIMVVNTKDQNQNTSVTDIINAAVVTAQLNMTKLRAERQTHAGETAWGDQHKVVNVTTLGNISAAPGEPSSVMTKSYLDGSTERGQQPSSEPLSEINAVKESKLDQESVVDESANDAFVQREAPCASDAEQSGESNDIADSKHCDENESHKAIENEEEEVRSDLLVSGMNLEENTKVIVEDNYSVENSGISNELKAKDLELASSSSPLTVQFSSDVSVHEETVIITGSVEEVITTDQEVADGHLQVVEEEVGGICVASALSETVSAENALVDEANSNSRFKCVEHESDVPGSGYSTDGETKSLMSCDIIREETASSIGSVKDIPLDVASIPAMDECTGLSEDPEISEALDAAETNITCVTGSVVDSECCESRSSLSQDETLSETAPSSMASNVNRIAMFSLIDNMMNMPISSESECSENQVEKEPISEVSSNVSTVDEKKVIDGNEGLFERPAAECTQSFEGSTSFKTWDSSLCEQTVSTETVVVEICEEADVSRTSSKNEVAAVDEGTSAVLPLCQEGHQAGQEEVPATAVPASEDAPQEASKEAREANTDCLPAPAAPPSVVRRKRKAPLSFHNLPLSPHLTGWARVASGLLERVCKYRSSGRSKNELSAHWFMEPVTAEEAPGYFDVVKHPMDFSTIKRKLESGQYKDLPEFHKDMMLVKENCELYNPPEHAIRQDCDELFSFYLQEYNRLVEKWQKSHLLSSPKRAKI